MAGEQNDVLQNDILQNDILVDARWLSEHRAQRSVVLVDTR